MTDLRKAAEMAMKWMEATHHTAMTTYSDEAYKEHCKVERELRQALAQPEQEPVAWVKDGVLWNSDLPEKFTGCLYTAPPKREWVGLTDDERNPLIKKCAKYYGYEMNVISAAGFYVLARDIEAALRSKKIAPPSKEWVGLTVEERRHYNNRLSGSGVAEEIEAKLKERQL